MATRHERVVLSLEDQFTTQMAKAAAATALMNKSLHDLDGSAADAGNSTREAGGDVDVFTKRTRDGGAEIDKFSGRLSVLRDAALTLGPALVPLGGAAVVGVAGLAAQFGALAGGAGVAIAALNGVGDALGAVNDYQLDPTRENLAAVQEEFNRLGDAGAAFVIFLESVAPQLRELQMTAREGFLPGLEEGIETFLTRGPQVNGIIGELAETMGDLSASTGEVLAGDRFDSFFEYLDGPAATTLGEIARSIGLVTEGLANMMVAFAPVSSQFSGGMEDMARSFAEWSSTLDSNESFQEFLNYLRTNGPAAVDFLSSLVQALASIVEAAAPVGQAVLPALTNLLDVFAKFAGTGFGTTILTAAAAFVALNRATSVLSPVAKGLADRLYLTSDSLAKVGTNAQTAGRGLGALKFAGILAGLMLVNQALDSLGTNLDNADLSRNLEAFANGAVVEDFDGVGRSIDIVSSSLRAMAEPLEEATSLLGLVGDTELDKAQAEVEALDQALAGLVESGDIDQAALAFERLMAAAVDRGVDADEAARQFDSYQTALANAGHEAEEAARETEDLGESYTVAGTNLERLQSRLAAARQELKASRQEARGVAQTFVNLGDSLNNSEVSLGDWLAELERNAQALRDFQRNAKEAGERGLDKGLVKSLQNAGQEGALRMRQLANATDAEIDRANGAWRKGQNAVKDFTNQVGGVPDSKMTKLEARVDEAMANLARLEARLRGIPDEQVNVWVTTRRVGGSPGMGPVEGFAAGGAVPTDDRPAALPAAFAMTGAVA